jgi:mannose-1-phosphate guanylyltransferase/mannose-6-phosphate isomerase
MIVVIIAGGSGTRLWPLSTPDHPKHLLKIDGDELSLLQHTFERAKQLTDKIYVASEASHIEHVKEQLSELPESAFIVEPARRGTANCILAAMVQIARDNPEDEPIIFLAADHYVRDINGFVHSFKLATEAAQKYQRIVLIGVEPDNPATGFGYIQKGQVLDEQSFLFNVSGFKEKPDHKTAVEYLKSGDYLWNCGYFVGTMAIFKKAMQDAAPDTFHNYQALAKATPETYKDVYLGFETISIDYALIEKVPDLLVVPASFDWMDLGSFADLHKAIGGDEQGNHVHGAAEVEDVQNSFIQNHDSRPIAVIGLDNVVVVSTPNGVVVARKDLSQKVGDVSKRFNKEGK